MKLTELVTALEDYKQLVQNAIDSLVTLDSVNGSLGLSSASTIALPPPNGCRVAGRAVVRKTRTTENSSPDQEGWREAPGWFRSRWKDLRETSWLREGQAGSLQAVCARLRAGMGPEKESGQNRLVCYESGSC